MQPIVNNPRPLFPQCREGVEPAFMASLAQLALQAGHQGTLGNQGSMGSCVKGLEA